MSNSPARPPLAPFVIADVLFLAMACVIFGVSHRPMLWWEAGLMVGCGSGAALSLMAPFLRQDRNQQALEQTAGLADVAKSLKELEQLSAHIHAATAQWNQLDSHTGQTLEHARQLSQNFAAEAKAFAEATQKNGEAEKGHLRVELEKLRRAEGEWLQTMVRIMDHVFALYQAALRSGQRNLAEQIGLFQDSCRETARKVGLLAVAPRNGDLFDTRLHQLRDNGAAPEKATVGEILASGYSYQGQLVRRAMVALPELKSEQNDLPLTQEAKP